MLRVVTTAAVAMLAVGTAYAQDAVSVDAGQRISIVGGCHDCHTPGYDESGGQIDPAKALTGNSVGYAGPWGVTYAKNLRLTAANFDEDRWVEYLKTFKAAPPMPWYNVHAFTESEMRSLYQYIKSLGEPGDPTPDAVPPGGTAKTPFIVMAPPQMPAG